jgi:hypothetical protein
VQRETPQPDGSQNGYPHIEPLEITDEELLEGIREAVEARTDMTFDEFVEAYREGLLPDTLATNELAMLLRFVELSSGVRI